MVSAMLVSVIRAVGNAPDQAVALPAKMRVDLHALVVVRCGVVGFLLAVVVLGILCGRDWVWVWRVVDAVVSIVVVLCHVRAVSY